MKKKDLYKQLVERYMNRTASVDELQIFFDLVEKGKLRKELVRATRGDVEALADRPAVPIISVIRRYSVAAAIIGLLSVGVFLLYRHSNRKEATIAFVNQFKNDVAPGGNHATLTLANGAKIILDSLGKGSLMNQGSAQVIKVNAGSLAYKAVGDEHTGPSYNTIATPAGGQYQVTLADGTQVWLNALSSIRFPTSFIGDARSVVLTGEAYFAVAKDKKKPFHVQVNGVDVQVLGTEFNINAYSDEPCTKTTLIQGSLQLAKANKTLLLKPGEGGQTNDASGFLLDKNVNIEQTLAWKNGYFSFDGANIRTIMRQIARWYNVEVHYQGDPGDGLFDGQIGRDLNLSEVLTGLSSSNVHFKIEGKVLTVLP